ncbi:hypothetical protein JWS13_09150 [Rhodococcus pseudokoreensis]|uniref:Uncharacterized protein n=1 Tax=Rhodococcus pseudokoreensis TaxID=2811421 RepID=A0A974W0S9_9NOCA|nr:hypothetical protein [Rhodococcus pseudokoreensis]QSE88759.1 hypothetical protein JWS13_09150 [Rhodococcus pseudokoreensis]
MTDEPRRGLDRILHSSFIPAKILGGRVRTSTLVLCILWVVLYTLYTYLNPAEEVVQGPVAPAVVPTREAPIQETTPPASEYETTIESTTETTTTTESTPEPTPEQTAPTGTGQVTSTPTLPFGIPNPFPPPPTTTPPTTSSVPTTTATPQPGR